MQIMGAWMQPLMTSMGQVYGEDYGVFTFPGTENWFGMCIDGFVVSNDSADVEAGVRWAYTVSTPEVQTAFSTLKESISPYTDTPDETYNELTLKFKNELHRGKHQRVPQLHPRHGAALERLRPACRRRFRSLPPRPSMMRNTLQTGSSNILKEAGCERRLEPC